MTSGLSMIGEKRKTESSHLKRILIGVYNQDVIVLTKSEDPVFITNMHMYLVSSLPSPINSPQISSFPLFSSEGIEDNIFIIKSRSSHFGFTHNKAALNLNDSFLTISPNKILQVSIFFLFKYSKYIIATCDALLLSKTYFSQRDEF